MKEISEGDVVGYQGPRAKKPQHVRFYRSMTSRDDKPLALVCTMSGGWEIVDRDRLFWSPSMLLDYPGGIPNRQTYEFIFVRER